MATNHGEHLKDNTNTNGNENSNTISRSRSFILRKHGISDDNINVTTSNVDPHGNKLTLMLQGLRKKTDFIKNYSMY